MIIDHKGYKITQMTGDLSARLRDAGGYIEILLESVAPDDLSFDIEGLGHLIDDLNEVQRMAQTVEAINRGKWKEDEEQ